MTDKQLNQIVEQLPEGENITRMYRAFEGDFRVITKSAADGIEKRYTVEVENGYPKLKLMP